MTKQELTELDDAEIFDLGAASELTEGFIGDGAELGVSRSTPPE